MSTNERANQLMGDCFGLTTFLEFEGTVNTWDMNFKLDPSQNKYNI